MTIKETDLSAAEYVAEQEVKEESARNRAFYLGEEDARQHLDPDATRHDISPEDRIDYDIGYQSEVKFRQHCERLDANKAQREEAEKQVLKSMVLHTEDVCQKLVPKAGRRFEVVHLNAEGGHLNPQPIDPGQRHFATFEAARLRALEILEENAMYGDQVLIEEQGELVELHTKEAK